MVYGDTTSEAVKNKKKVRVPDIIASKGIKKIAALTCYDALMARLLEKTAVDIVLVGDSLGHVIQGKSSTITVKLEEIEYHTKAVATKLKSALLVADMPFGTAGFEDNICWLAAQKLICAGAEAVKIEGASIEICNQIHKLVTNGIPVMGHIGLTPQSIHALGGYKVQGKDSSGKNKLVEAACALEEAGCFSLVLELIDKETAAAITQAVNIPTIGIGAGAQCDGQILVVSDMLGFDLSFQPKFLKRYAELQTTIIDAVEQYCCEVKDNIFPS